MPPDPKSARASTPQALIPETDRAGPKPAFDSEQYNKVARAVQLLRISLISSRFFILPEFFFGQSDQAPKLNFQAKMANPKFDAENGTASCEWEWGMTAEAAEKVTFNLEATYLLAYGALKDCDFEAIQFYMRRVGRFTAYPYFRAKVSQLSWESGANIPILPSIAT